MVVGLGPLCWEDQPPALALVDGDAGTVIFDPEPETRRLFEQRMNAANDVRAIADAGRVKPAITADGRRIAVLLNIAAPEDLAGLDPAIVKKLHGEIIDILASADVKERIRTLGYDVIASTPAEFGAQVKNDVERWSEVVKRANVPMN